MRQPGRQAAREIERAERRIQQLYEKAKPAGKIRVVLYGEPTHGRTCGPPFNCLLEERK